MMKSTTTLLAISLLALLSASAATDPNTTLLFDTPARTFHESLPLGNGRVGAMVFGGVDEERIVLNESSMWSGSHGDVEDRVWSELKQL
jgi:alpha-L-fucosidase 2